MKTTITKIFAFLLAATICASFAACSQSEPQNDTDVSDSSSTTPAVNVPDGDDQDTEGSADDENGGENDAEDNDGEQTSDLPDAAATEEGETTAPEESTSPEESTAPEEEPDSDSADEDGNEGPENEGDTETAVITTEEEQQPAPAGKGDAIAQKAESAVGYDYLYGGKSPEDGGFDNSGLVYYALTANGITCPRTTAEIMKIGSEVSYDELRRGDVVIFKMDDGSDIVFSGVYIGDGQAVMSFSEGIPVKIVDVATNYYRNTFVKGVRVTE